MKIRQAACFLLRFQEPLFDGPASNGTKTGVPKEQPDLPDVAAGTRTITETRAEQSDPDVRHQSLLSIPR